MTQKISFVDKPSKKYIFKVCFKLFTTGFKGEDESVKGLKDDKRHKVMPIADVALCWRWKAQSYANSWCCHLLMKGTVISIVDVALCWRWKAQSDANTWCCPLFQMNLKSGRWVIMVLIVWQLVLQLPVQSVPITTKVVSSNPTHGEVYSILHYVIKVCQWFSLCTQASSNKIHCHDITEQLLKVALNIINLTPKKLKHRFKMLPMYF